MQHMHTFVSLAILLAFFACQFNTSRGKEGAVRGGVHHLDQTRVEVDFRGQRRDGD